MLLGYAGFVSVSLWFMRFFANDEEILRLRGWVVLGMVDGFGFCLSGLKARPYFDG